MSAPRPVSAAQRLAARKDYLLLESTALRGLLVDEVLRLQRPAGLVDRAALLAAWAARRPWWVLGGVGAALVFAGPTRLRRWGVAALGGWRLWQRYGGIVGMVLPSLLGSRPPQDEAAAPGASADPPSPSSALR